VPLFFPFWLVIPCTNWYFDPYLLSTLTPTYLVLSTSYVPSRPIGRLASSHKYQLVLAERYRLRCVALSKPSFLPRTLPIPHPTPRHSHGQTRKWHDAYGSPRRRCLAQGVVLSCLRDLPGPRRNVACVCLCVAATHRPAALLPPQNMVKTAKQAHLVVWAGV